MLVVRMLGGTEKVRDMVEEVVEGAAVIRKGVGFGVCESSRISKTEDSRDDVSAAFLLNLLMILGLAGVPLQECCLWQDVWKVDLHAKHFIGLEFFFRSLLQSGQVTSAMVVLVAELLKLFSRTDLLKAEMS